MSSRFISEDDYLLKIKLDFFLKHELRFLFYEIYSQVLNFKVMCSFLAWNENQIYF